MPEKTYTMTELVTNLRAAADRGDLRICADVGAALGVMLGYPLTDEGFEQFDADLTAAGL